MDSKSLATLALLGAFGAFQVLLTYCADLSAPDSSVSPLPPVFEKQIKENTVSLRQKVSVAFGKALEADLPGVFLRSVANPRALLPLVLGSFLKQFAFWT